MDRDEPLFALLPRPDEHPLCRETADSMLPPGIRQYLRTNPGPAYGLNVQLGLLLRDPEEPYDLPLDLLQLPHHQDCLQTLSPGIKTHGLLQTKRDFCKV